MIQNAFYGINEKNITQSLNILEKKKKNNKISATALKKYLQLLWWLQSSEVFCGSVENISWSAEAVTASGISIKDTLGGTMWIIHIFFPTSTDS